MELSDRFILFGWCKLDLAPCRLCSTTMAAYIPYNHSKASGLHLLSCLFTISYIRYTKCPPFCSVLCMLHSSVCFKGKYLLCIHAHSCEVGSTWNVRCVAHTLNYTCSNYNNCNSYSYRSIIIPSKCILAYSPSIKVYIDVHIPTFLVWQSVHMHLQYMYILYMYIAPLT